jgi:membrane protease YdiL (CAAX protease family)
MGLFAWGAASVISAEILHQRQGDRSLSGAQQVLIYGATDLAALIGLLWATVAFRSQGIRRLGIGMSRFPFGLVGGLISLVIVLPLIYWIDLGSEMVWNRLQMPHESAHDLLLIMGSTQSIWLRASIVFTAVVLAPLTEEMFFRGQIQTFLRYVVGKPWVAVLITAACFAAVHRQWWAWPSLFFLGICLGYLYERTGNLWNCVILHALFNLASIYIYVHTAAHG